MICGRYWERKVTLLDCPIRTVLLVDDNIDDCELVREAWSELPIGEELRCVHDGSELLDYLHRQGAFMEEDTSPRPSVILLDLNMPLMAGLEVLREIKKQDSLARIPILVFTTSKAPRDISQSANLGVNGYMPKPDSFSGYLQMLSNIRQYWPEILAQSSVGKGDDWSENVAWC